MSAGLLASTVTPGSTAADGSRTTPAIVDWANSTVGSNRIRARAPTTYRTRRIRTSSSSRASALEPSRLRLARAVFACPRFAGAGHLDGRLELSPFQDVRTSVQFAARLPHDRPTTLG